MASRAQRVQSMSAAGLKLQPGAIELDLPRTFPKLSVFNEDGSDLLFFPFWYPCWSYAPCAGPFHRQLWDILETYAIFRPEIGYVLSFPLLPACPSPLTYSSCVMPPCAGARYVIPGGHVPALHG